MLDPRNLRTLRQLAEECPAFSYHALRKLAQERESNGLPVIAVGRRVYVDRERFGAWLSARPKTSRPSAPRLRRSAAR